MHQVLSADTSTDDIEQRHLPCELWMRRNFFC